MILDTALKSLACGDSASFTVHRVEFPASLYTMQFVITRDGSMLFTKNATPNETDPDDYDINLVSADTIGLKPGPVQTMLVFTLAADLTQRFTERFNNMALLPNPLDQLTPSANQIALQGIKDAIAAITASPTQSVNFNGQSYSTHNIKDLMAMRDRMQVIVNNELAALGIIRKGQTRTIINRFR